MESRRDELCLLIDMDGFFLGKKHNFHVRELGYYSWNGDNRSFFFDVRLKHKDLSDKDKVTVKHVCRNIMGLPLKPSPSEKPVYHPRNLKQLVKRLYKEYRTEFRTKVGFKGGKIEKELLLSSSIPYTDIETWGCPRYEQLPKPKREGCGCHSNPETNHCPMMECESFWNWTRLALEEM